ncbi:MAG: hypothetical protein SV253_05560 [Halobacteria archaeon]|nr:hypothetical protein [Halobacteria archaeon]
MSKVETRNTNLSLLTLGVVVTLMGAVGSVWSFYEGDPAMGGGLLLFVVSGLLYIGISRSSASGSQSETPDGRPN